MKKLLFILYTLHFLLFTLLNAASVEAVLSQSEVVQGNPVQLKIIAKGDHAEFPQINEIDGVPIEGRSQTQQTSLQIINGKSTVEHTTNLILTFTPTKEIQIPSYTVNIDGKPYQTDPLKVTVVKSTAPKSLSQGRFSLMMKAEPSRVIVGEPLLVKVYFALRNDIRLSDNPQYTRPEFKGFLVKEVEEQKRYQKGDYRITELRYVLVPEKEGNFTIGPAMAKIGVADRSRRDIFGRFFGTVWTPIASNRVDIHVDPAPQDSDLIGRFYIESKIDKTETKENKPVNLTVTIEGDGSLEDYVMPNYEIDGVTVYSDDAEVSTKVIGDKLKSTYVKKFVFIADHDFTIPARTITVYDPKNKETKTLEIPTYTIHVASKKGMAAATQDMTEEHSGEVQTNLKLPKNTTVASVPKTDVPNEMTWWVVVLAFLAGMVTMYLFGNFKLQWKKSDSLFKENDALKILYGHISEDPEVEAMVRKLYAKKNGQKDVIIDKKELKALVERYTRQ